MNQHEWVYGCYQHYLENQIEPGNPEDGVWEEAHWPVPACKGGSKTVLLLKEHHAVHNVLQSEEWNHPCVFSWEGSYLEGKLLSLFKKWLSEKGRRSAEVVNNRLTPEERSERAKRRWDGVSPEKRTERARKANASRTKEGRASSARKAARASVDGRTPEERSEAIRKGWETRKKNNPSAGKDSSKKMNEARRGKADG
jgi:hypothetical protein